MADGADAVKDPAKTDPGLNTSLGTDEDAALRERVVQLGFLDLTRAERALVDYRKTDRASDFGKFLVEKNLITGDQLLVLKPAASDTTPNATPAPAAADEYEPVPPPSESALKTMADEPDWPLNSKLSGCLVQRKLGQGGMGAVYLARREEDGEPVVVKLLAPEQANKPKWRARFIREAQMMKRITHPNIVGVFTVEGDAPQPYIVMEYVSGKELADKIRQRPLEAMEAARIARDIASGLAEAHRNGIIHRDIKPANVLITDEGHVKILDFGLAKEVAAEDGLSMPGQILGTPHYMAPEQWGAHKVDARCDVYALGATLYHLVTGRHPFPGRTATEISKKVAEGVYERPKNLVPGIPEDLELAILQMMALDRRYRYPSAEQCVAALECVLEGRPVEVPRVVERKGNKRHPLMPGATFVMGRDAGCDIVVLDRTVSRQHVKIERSGTGFALHDLGSSGGTFVDGMKVKDVILKDGDEIKLGQVAFEFRDGGLSKMASATRRISTPDRMQVETAPAPVVQALSEDADKRIVLSLLEDLAPDFLEVRVSAAREALREILGGEDAEKAGSKMEARLRKQRVNVPGLLFTITHENLGEDIEAWLSWWDGARETYPRQIAPAVPSAQAQLRITRGEAGPPRTVPLDPNTWVYTVGRDEKSKVAVQSQSVSRLHATILRLAGRLVIRDEGSRFGTVVNGKQVRLALLKPSDRVLLGKVELTFETVSPPPAPIAPGTDTFAIDPEAYLALEEAQSPSCAAALVKFLQAEAASEWADIEANRFHADEAKRTDFAKHVRQILARRTKAARALLPKLLGECAEGSPAAWQQLLQQKLVDLPSQVIPAGWF